MERQQLHERQTGLCAICRCPPAAHIDHDHDSGLVRGVLCFNCNAGLGLFTDRSESRTAALAYLGVANGEGAPDRTSWPRVIEMYPYRGAEIDGERWRHPIGA